MKTIIGSNIIIVDPSIEILKWCKNNLELSNPDFIKKSRMGFWTGNTPRKITLYAATYDELILPFGTLRSIGPLICNGEIEPTFKEVIPVDYKADIPLYDYQKEAVNQLQKAQYGILQSPAGSGKTQIGIALAARIGVRTLWLTHTKDLLQQSKERAAQYIDRKTLGTITEGKVNIGQTITFATVQTLSRVDLEQFKDTWDCIIVDECHRVAGTPTAVTQFSKVLNVLRARHKYGLSATVHRADGLIKATYALLGEVVYIVPDAAVKGVVMKVGIKARYTGVKLTKECLGPDGQVNHAKTISYYTHHVGRNSMIIDDLKTNKDRSCLILSERVEHLSTLYWMLGKRMQTDAVVIDGKTPKEIRAQALDDMRSGKKKYLFATYQLAKEGLDIPCLNRLFLATPQRDFAVIVQAVGRIARNYEGKDDPVAYDYVDYGKSAHVKFRERRNIYYKMGFDLIKEDEIE